MVLVLGPQDKAKQTASKETKCIECRLCTPMIWIAGWGVVNAIATPRLSKTQGRHKMITGITDVPTCALVR
jgi:hypothetical protein